MDDADLYSITEPNDFSNDQLIKLDSSLRCSICKDLITSPMITPCSHSFCSLCIRESLTVAAGKCPVCQTTVTDGQLKRNTMLSEISEAYKQTRTLLLRLELQSLQPLLSLSRKRRRSDTSMESVATTSKVPRLDHRSSSGAGSSKGIQATPTKAKGRTMVSCPVCDDIVDSEYINLHLDKNCKLDQEDIEEIQRTSEATKPSNGQAKAWANVFGSSKKGKLNQADEIPSRRIPKMNYDLKSLKQLRDLIADIGLSDKGELAQLKLRHERWVNLWNAEVDATNPRTKSQLLKEMAEWEKGRLKAKPPPKVDDAQEWLENNKGQFDQLVSSAKATSKKHAADRANGNDSNGEIIEITSSSPPTER